MIIYRQRKNLKGDNCPFCAEVPLDYNILLDMIIFTILRKELGNRILVTDRWLKYRIIDNDTIKVDVYRSENFLQNVCFSSITQHLKHRLPRIFQEN